MNSTVQDLWIVYKLVCSTWWVLSFRFDQKDSFSGTWTPDLVMRDHWGYHCAIIIHNGVMGLRWVFGSGVRCVLMVKCLFACFHYSHYSLNLRKAHEQSRFPLATARSSIVTHAATLYHCLHDVQHLHSRQGVIVLNWSSSQIADGPCESTTRCSE